MQDEPETEDGAESCDASVLEGLAREYEHRVPFFARTIARRYRMESRWEDDLLSAGYWGLAKALHSRRPGASRRELSAYVSQRISGAVIDEARACLTRSTTREVLVAFSDEAGAGVLDSETPLSRLASGGVSPESATAARRVQSLVEDVLSALDGDERRMIRAYMDGASLSDIAAHEKIPVGTLRVRFHKLTRRLRGRMRSMRHQLWGRETG